MNYCQCHSGPPRLSAAIRELYDELIEFFKKPTRDELSDCVYACGRILGAFSHHVYVHVPGDGRHLKKINERFRLYGCIRSPAHLINGRCPSAPTEKCAIQD